MGIARERHPQNTVAPVAIQGTEPGGKSGQQIQFGQYDIDRQTGMQRLADRLQLAAQRLYQMLMAAFVGGQ